MNSPTTQGSLTRALVTIIVILLSGSAYAWDAGPAKCKHDECSGGALDVGTGVPDTQPKWANSTMPSSTGRVADCPSGYTNNGLTCGRGAHTIAAGSRVANCPAGYTNMGLTCYRGPSTYAKRGCRGGCSPGYTDNGCFCGRGASSLGTGSMTCPDGYFLNRNLGRCYKNCPPGYTNTGETCYRAPSTLGIESMSCRDGEFKSGVRCYPNSTCPAGREYWGGLCYVKCPGNSTRSAVSTCVHKIRWRGNTHLFVVNNALAALNASGDPIGMRAYATMTQPACRTDWENGLWDADDGDLADSPPPGRGAPGSHFYNASGRDETGRPTSVVTYMYFGAEQNRHGNARSRARDQTDALTRDPLPCYKLGLALHYLTDMTQPMHATSFSGGSIPLMLHPVLEMYAPTLHSRVRRPDWDRRWVGQVPDDVFVEASKKAATLAPPLMSTLRYDGTICTMTPEPGITYTGFCFLNVPAVDHQVTSVIEDGIQTTASYLYSIFRALP